ncbi:hypothetical protein RhiirA5_475782 [Rhizophagus irregularis]|uniref:Uncharacterized protein n=1 Tax=Rhizophagus irregularis TaxID=588596 RepID=A0A2I1ELS1_9GLOM|nr:hypothetical protein RhiirA5_475782 [Rhizophagus irregularis]PKY23076.1 hypothetical protein RhiirB3_437193 [Rhizophagus irregularis]PKY54675.1 hypothetical protein RhiirA4_409991 [Rhizophagus irregularis]
MNEIEKQEKEFYSKLQVAGSIKFVVGEESDEFIGLTKPKLTKNEKFSRDLATILARKKEAVAVNLTTYPDYCIIYISKNSNWLQVDFEYINKIQECLIKISKYEPMKWEEAIKKSDTKTLSASVIAYCSEKFESRLDKLKRDIRDGKNDQYIKSFIEYASNSVDINHDKANKLIISRVCCCYYKKVSKDVTIPKKFLKHLKKVGSYMRSLIDITSCACNKKYKVLFSNMKLHILKPIVTYQPIFSWKNIIQRFIPDPMEYENFKNACLGNKIKASRLEKIYDDVKNLELESIKQGIYLHAEMNILNEIMNQKKKARVYIAVSKKCCYLCELYIKFAQKQGYNIVISGTHKKIYNLWKLPTDVAFKSNFLSYVLKELDKIIQEEIDSSSSLLAESGSDESSADKIKVDDEEHNANLDAELKGVYI